MANTGLYKMGGSNPLGCRWEGFRTAILYKKWSAQPGDHKLVYKIVVEPHSRAANRLCINEFASTISYN